MSARKDSSFALPLSKVRQDGTTLVLVKPENGEDCFWVHRDEVSVETYREFLDVLESAGPVHWADGNLRGHCDWKTRAFDITNAVDRFPMSSIRTRESALGTKLGGDSCARARASSASVARHFRKPADTRASAATPHGSADVSVSSPAGTAGPLSVFRNSTRSAPSAAFSPSGRSNGSFVPVTGVPPPKL